MMIETALDTYLGDLQAKYQHQEAREHTYRPAIQKLLEALGAFEVLNDPAQIQGVGKPDFILKSGRTQVAFVETKDISVNLDKALREHQMQTYLRALPNLLLTDYLEFRWYYRGELKETARVGEIHKGKIKAYANLDPAARLLEQFAGHPIPTVNNAEDLAKDMASMAHNIKALIIHYLPDSPALQSQREAFAQTLIPNLTDADFADMYAQTLAYGLFAARVDHRGKPDDFTVETVFFRMPKTNPFLTDFFQRIVPDLDPRVRWQVDTLATLLAFADTDQILAGFGRKTRQEDPIVHFYETFLASYDPKMREARGVYYTPEPVVSFIVRSVDHLLKARFGRRDGLADQDTYILDPATGTGTFLYFVIQQIYEQLGAMRGIWDQYVNQHLLKRVFGFELLMAPYAVAHMKLGLQLREMGYQFATRERLGVYLTNSLEEQIKQAPLPMAHFISEEANQAIAVKTDRPIMVVLGNPPYSGHSANRSKNNTGQLTAIGKLLQDYYQVDGQPLGERNPKWLQDDYVKFIRFGQDRISRTQHGILAFVTNHGYLDNPTFRGMRQHLLDEFDEIYLLDLHGNAKKKETAPDGSVDQNVFDIQQGVAIGIFVKHQRAENDRKTARARVYHADLYGVRKDKYAFLNTHDLQSMIQEHRWTELQPQTPYYLFRPLNLDLNAEYQAGWKITDIMPVNSVGIVTARDHFSIHFTKQAVATLIQDFVSLTDEMAREKYDLGKDTRDWKVKLAQKDLETSGINDKNITRILYRPFDERYTYYTGQTKGFHCMPRHNVMRHMMNNQNLALLTCRQQVLQGFYHVLCSDTLSESSVVSNNSREITSAFPLYLYTDPNKKLMETVDKEWEWSAKGRRPNLSAAFVREICDRIGGSFAYDEVLPSDPTRKTVTPEDIFAYAYAVFHDPNYRSRYAEFLKIDFPRLPMPHDADRFWTLAGYGRRLIDAHLLRAALKSPVTFPERGSGKVEKRYPTYDAGASRVWINREQYFSDVPESAWEFQIGGYQVLEKWLKDRRDRALSPDDVRGYFAIVAAITETIAIMEAIEAMTE
ncbi:MAG: N-6 DNA methylase [Anaerolineae bacterium]|nr:N-6 DNA methylase [Anaerolineae bacterium]